MRRVGDIVNGASEFEDDDDEPADPDREGGAAELSAVQPLRNAPGSPYGGSGDFGFGHASPQHVERHAPQRFEQHQRFEQQQQQPLASPRRFSPGPEDSAEAYYPQQVSLKAPPRVSPRHTTPLNNGGVPPPPPPVAASLVLQRMPSHPCEVPDTAATSRALGTAAGRTSLRSSTNGNALLALAAATAAPQAQPAVDPNDPWARLQTQYRIDASPASPPPPRGACVPGAQQAAAAAAAQAAATGPALQQQQQQRKGMLVLGDDDDDVAGGFGLGLYGMAGARQDKAHKPSAPAAAAAAKPKQPQLGGWGNGNLASAGTLMLGHEDWVAAAEQQQQRPVADVYAHAQQRPADRSMDDLDEMYREVVTSQHRQPPVAVTNSKVVHDMVFEDIDDVDKMLEEEFRNQGITDKHLADKLRAFERQFAHQDY